MNKSPWHNDDISWRSLREQQLPIYLEFVKSHYPGDVVRNPDEYLRRAREYYFEGALEGGYADGVSHLDVSDYFVMHPCLDLAAARDIVAFYDRVGCMTRGYFGQYYLIPKSFGPMVDQGMLPASIGEVVIEAFYGESYLEASSLRGFEPERSAVAAGCEMCRELGSWMDLPLYVEYYPVQRLIDLTVGALEYFSAGDLVAKRGYIEHLSVRIEDIEAGGDSMQKSFSDLLKTKIFSSQTIDEIKVMFE
ncbi:hypothetical protein AAFN46_00950 [Pseudomonas sp. CAU 1711]|uniref:hypothetical protein n=1 Tax=Pseudomonas sp. CAU 1711 TaxID=3140356 RepID=UPI0032610E44